MEIVIIVLLLVLNGVFAMYEIALVSSSRARLKNEAARGSRKAETTLRLLDDHADRHRLRGIRGCGAG